MKNLKYYEKEKVFNKILTQICYSIENKESFYSNDLKIIIRNNPHEVKKLNENEMAIYIFIYNGEFLKIGKVYSKSNARFTSQHYNPNSKSVKSSLARSLLDDEEYKNKYKLNEKNIKNWMNDKLERIDIILDTNILSEKKIGVFLLNLLESNLHFKYVPRYEGYKRQYFK